MTEIERVAEMFRKRGIEPSEVIQEEMEHDAMVDVDRVYGLQHAPYEKKPWCLSKWIECGTIMKEVGCYATPQEAVDRYMLDMKYNIQ